MDFYRTLRSKISAATHHDLRDREKKEEFFKFAKTVQHGFPSKPSCLAYDSTLNIFAIGTKTGFVKVFGAPGVEFVGQLANGSPIVRLLFLPNQGRLISLCDDQSFHLWEVDVESKCGKLNQVKECTAAGKLKKISCWCLRQESDACAVLIGTESGNVYAMDMTTLELTDYIIYQDAVIQNIPDDYKLNPGAVEALAVHPTDPSKVLIGYNRGLIVLWDSTLNSACRTFVEGFQVESLSWCHDGESFLSAHNDGSYVTRNVASDSDGRSEVKPFGPFPLKPIEKIMEKAMPNRDSLLIFTGGMPRSTYSDKFAVTVEWKSSSRPTSHTKQVVFDFTSKVVDFFVVDTPDADNFQRPSALVVVCDEELVGIDLISEDWPTFRLPYCYSLHSSPIMACVHVADVDAQVAAKIVDDGRKRMRDNCKYSTKEWPINGGVVLDDAPTGFDFLITGHEDGTVKFWSARTSSMDLVYVLNVAQLFDGYVDPNDATPEEEGWPPFRKVGMYDPYTDDPRFGVQRLVFDAQTGTLVVGCSAGQITVWEICDKEREAFKPEATSIDIVEGFENFAWKGQQKLEYSKACVNVASIYAPKSCLQLHPPAAVTALALKADWHLVAAGTAQGFALFDYSNKKTLTKKCLLTVADVNTGAASSEGTVSRFKSFKKSLRDSFRRRRRQQRSPKSMSPEPPATKPVEEHVVEGAAAASTEHADAKKDPEGVEAEAAKETTKEEEKKEKSPARQATTSPVKRVQIDNRSVSPVRSIVERSVEARADTDQLASMVRSLYFCQTNLVHASTTSPTFWVGTNGGAIYIHLLTLSTSLPAATEAGGVGSEPSCQLAKEIRLKHRAPVLNMCIVDGRGFPLDNQPPTTATATVAAAEHHGQRLIVVSEEQLKAFHWPKLTQSRIKYKVTAHEGSRIRKVQFVNLRSKNDENKMEPFVVIMTNQGDVECFTTMNFKRLLLESCVPSNLLTGILSTLLTRTGEGFYLLSSSEWQRFSVDVKAAVRPHCTLELPEGARPPVAPDVQPESLVHENDKKEENAGDKAADTTGTSEDMHNVSATMSSDMTMDSIRDYTTESHVVENSTTTTMSGVTTITTKTSKIVVTEKKFGDIKEEMTNGADHHDEEIVVKKITQEVVTSGPTTIVAE